MNSLQIPDFREKLAPEDSFSLTKNWMEGQGSLLLWIISYVEKVFHAKSLMDEEINLEEHKSRLAFVVLILKDGIFGGK